MFVYTGSRRYHKQITTRTKLWIIQNDQKCTNNNDIYNDKLKILMVRIQDEGRERDK